MDIRNVIVGGYVAQTCRKTGDVFIGIAREKNETTGTVRVQWGVAYPFQSIVIASELSPAMAADASTLRSRSVNLEWLRKLDAPYGELPDGSPKALEDLD